MGPHGALRIVFHRVAEAGREWVSALAQWWGVWHGWVFQSCAMVSSEAGVSIPKLCNGVARVGPSPLGETEGAFIFSPATSKTQGRPP